MSGVCSSGSASKAFNPACPGSRSCASGGTSGRRSRTSTPEAVARYGARQVERLLGDAGIVRHRGKIEAAIANARGTLTLREAGTPLEQVVWAHRPKRQRKPRTARDWQPTTAESVALSKTLKSAGFRFVGPTTVYAAMQACGIVNDHLTSCHVRADVEREIAQLL